MLSWTNTVSHVFFRDGQWVQTSSKQQRQRKARDFCPLCPSLPFAFPSLPTVSPHLWQPVHIYSPQTITSLPLPCPHFSTRLCGASALAFSTRWPAAPPAPSV